MLPQYNYDKMMNTVFDLNSVDFDSKNAYFNIFPMIENDENKLAAKKLMEELKPTNNSPMMNKSKKIISILNKPQDMNY